MRITAMLLGMLFAAGLGRAGEVVFQDSFSGRLGPGWSWIRENKAAWRVTPGGLEIRVQPGNMWGGANDAKNILVRPAPAATEHEHEISVTVSNRPTGQYEQVNLVWYYNDSHMVKLGQEMVDGKLSVVMGREEKDRTRTICIIPIDTLVVQVRFLVKNNQLRGEFRPGAAGAWREAGACDLPVHGEPHISLQCYQGPRDAEHWARITDFTIRKN